MPRPHSVKHQTTKTCATCKARVPLTQVSGGVMQRGRLLRCSVCVARRTGNTIVTANPISMPSDVAFEKQPTIVVSEPTIKEVCGGWITFAETKTEEPT